MIRLFTALSLPAETRASLHAWSSAAVGADPALRVLPPDSLHVTLVFLGWVEERDANHVAAATCSAARRLPQISVTGAAWLPPRRPPSVLVADLTLSGEFAALHQDLVAELARWHDPETRPFRPHVTIARVRRGQRLRTHDLPEPPPLTFAPEALVLYRSHMGRGGSRYEPLAITSL